MWSENGGAKESGGEQEMRTSAVNAVRNHWIRWDRGDFMSWRNARISI